ncbi:MFS transporter [Thermodesulfobacteriota bacterium]
MHSGKKIVWMTSFSHFITHGYMTLLPAVLIAIAGEHSMSFTDIGIIANIGYFLYGLGSFPAGYFADRIGSKRVLSLGILGMAISSLLVGVSRGTFGFAAAYAALGIFASIHHPAGLSLIARRIDSGKGRALGFHGVFGNLGLFFSPLVAGLAVIFFGSWRAAYILYGIIGLFFFLIIYYARVEDEKDFSFKDILRWIKGENHESIRESSSAKSKIGAGIVIPAALLLLYLGSILSGFIFRGSLTFFPTLFQQDVSFASHHDEPMVIAGYITTGVLSFGLIGAWFGGYVTDKIKHPELIPAVIFLVVTPCLYLISRFTEYRLILISGLFSLIYYAWQPTQNYLIAKYTKKSSHGMGFGFNFFLIFGMGSLATSTGGYVTDQFSVDQFYLIMAMVAATALFAALSVFLFRNTLLRSSSQTAVKVD